MTTATLPKRPVTKEIVTEAPEKLYPARSKLNALLNEYSAVTNGVNEFEGKLSRAQLDLDHAIDSDNDEQIDRYQSQLSIYSAKLSAKKMVLAKLVASLSEAVYAASTEYGTLLLDERNRRIGIFSRRVAQVLGADADRLIEGRFLDDLLDESEPIKEIDRLRFSTNLVGASAEVTLSEAHRLLDYFGEIIKAAKETI